MIINFENIYTIYLFILFPGDIAFQLVTIYSSSKINLFYPTNNFITSCVYIPRFKYILR